MAFYASYQPACYILERDLKLPFSRKVPFAMMHSGHSKLLITGRVNSSPTEFKINIRSANKRENTYFQMSQRWKEDRATFNNSKMDIIQNLQEWGTPEYVRFPSLKPDSDFTIDISILQEHLDRCVFHFKVGVNDDPVVMFRYKDFGEKGNVEIEISSTNNDISVSLVKLDVAE